MGADTDPKRPRTIGVEEAIALARSQILADPDFVLRDPELMRALLAPTKADRQVVDLRGALVDSLERRLDVLTEAHRDVVDALWDDVAQMEPIHRAALAALDAESFDGLLETIAVRFLPILEIDAARLCLESAALDAAPAGRRSAALLRPGELEALFPLRAAAPSETDPAPVRLCSEALGAPPVFGEFTARVRSIALIRLDLGSARPAGLLALGAEDPARFHESQDTELLGFLGAVVQRCVRARLAAFTEG